MRIIVVVIVYLFTLFVVQGQQIRDRIIYLDSLEQLANEDNYHTLRIMKDFYSDNPGCMVYEYYKSGKKKSIAKYSDKYNLMKEGEYISYFENGNKSALFHFKDNEPIGKFYTWHQKGNIKSEGEFVQFKRIDKPILKVNHYWSRIGIHRVVNGNGRYDDEGSTWYSEGELKNGFQDGEWTGFDLLNQTSFKETYKAGILVSGVSTDSLKKTYTYKLLEAPAKPKQTKNQIFRYLKENIRIPAHIATNKLSGTVRITFIINKDGWVSQPKVIQEMGFGMDEELVRVLQNMDAWHPAKRRGVPIESQYTIPFSVNKGKF